MPAIRPIRAACGALLGPAQEALTAPVPRRLAGILGNLRVLRVPALGRRLKQERFVVEAG